MGNISNHRRVNDILLGPLERPTLKWLASRMPAWVTPDTCTMIGVVGSTGTALSYVLSTYDPNFLWLASFCLVVHWFGDSLDGTLARYRRIERPIYGFFVDHMLDAFSTTIIFLGLGLTPYISFNVACLTLIGYLLLCVLAFLRTNVAGEFKISYYKLGPTEFRLVAILLNATMFFNGVPISYFMIGNIHRMNLTPYDFALIFIALLLFYFFAVTAVRETIRLARENR